MSTSTTLKASLWRSRDTVTTVLLALLVLLVLFVLWREATTYARLPRLFPLMSIYAGAFFTVALLFKLLVFDRLFPGRVSEDLISTYLSGAESQYSLPVRVRRLALFVGWIALFFVLAGFNLILGITVCYVGAMVSLGVRRYRLIAASVLALDAFLVVVFLYLLRVPLGLFGG